jgi:pimeloyl-ACP methyl ester carboxylesterase
MSAESEVLEVSYEAIGRTVAGLRSDAKLQVNCNGTVLNLQVSRRKNPRLLVLFHGAVTPDRRHLVTEFNTPRLANLVDANVVAVTDPSLAQSPTLTAAWYLGHETFRSQKLLTKMFRQLEARLRIVRTVFVGGSAGGFAALYYSWASPGSIAIAVNPQTSLTRHRRSHEAAYRAACWPGLAPELPLASVVHEDLALLYKKRVPNSVVYLQNCMDPFHLRNHFAPFIGAIRPADLSRVVTNVGFWGTVGHSNSIPRQVWFDWAKTALAAETTDAVGLLAAHQRSAIVPRPGNKAKANENDIAVARHIAKLAKTALANGATP